MLKVNTYKAIVMMVSLGLNMPVMGAEPTRFSASDLAKMQSVVKQESSQMYYETVINYKNGERLVQNYAKALEWFQKAADQEYANAQNNIGDMYETGKGVKLDDVKAAKWYLKAANQGVAEAQNSLGLMYFEGRGVEQDKVKSQEWYSKSCDNGYWPSCDEL